MAIKYLYIDDSPQRKGTAKGLSSTDELQIVAIEPKNWKEILEDIEEQKIDGLLLDWQLQGNNQIPDYSSVALAQEIRELSNQGKPDLPIILCSAQEGFKTRYDRDRTSHNLFDEVYPKEDLNEPSKNSSLIKQFISLAKGYKELNKTDKTYLSILNIGEASFNILDIRFQEELKTLFQSPPHEIARFILREVIEFQGILVDEYVLAARFGINRDKSEDWDKLKNILAPYRYNGVFSDAWERWWWFEIDNFWKKHFNDIPLRSSPAAKRVEYIRKVTNLKLECATPNEFSKSDLFWTSCIKTNIPIDTIDGFTLSIEDIVKPWQEKHYVSTNYLLNSGDVKIISSIEKPRLKKLKELYGNRPQ